MANIRSVIANNNATFYNYRTRQRLRLWPRICIFVMISPVIAFLLTENLTNFINSINTVLSILLGFSFSVLFYIAGNKEGQSPSEVSLEKMNRIERLNALSKELFHNVSYFVMTASAALAFAMIVIAPETLSDWLSKQTLPYLLKVVPNASNCIWWANLVIRSIFFFLIIEAAYTFARIIGRVNFLFEEKITN